MFNKEIYITRRKKLTNEIKSGIGLFLGNVDAAYNYPANTYSYRQDSHFLYFFGLNHPGFAGVINFDNNTDMIFANDVDIEDIIWMGNQPTVKDMASKVGIEHTAPYRELASYLHSAISQGQKIHFLPAYRGETMIELSKLLNLNIDKLKGEASVELIKAVVKLKEIKDGIEIAEIEKAIDIAYLMHTTSMKLAKPGMVEQEIAGTIEGISLALGGPVSFPIILSQDGQTLHNHDHSKVLKEGRMMVTDAGAETQENYCSDITRTVPVGGKFNKRQAGIYQVVLDANMAAIAAIKPGLKYREVHFLACRTIVDGLKELGLMKGDTQAAIDARAHTLFMPHGLGHMMGMDVHDLEGLGENHVGYDENTTRSTEFGNAYLRLGKELKPGMVLTVEPGIYFIPALIDQYRKEGTFDEFINFDLVETYKDFGGIRIEDDVLVTENSHRVLGKPIPKTIAEIEKTMAEPREWLKWEGYI
jgi:Xaa-Pro aminopeptidase